MNFAIEEAARGSVEYRKGLPRQIFAQGGVGGSGPLLASIQGSLQELLNGLTEHLETAVHESLDELSIDFVQSRLPPSQAQLEEMVGEFKDEVTADGTIGPFPASNSLFVRVLDADVLRMVINEDPDNNGSSDGSSDEEDEEEEDDVDYSDPFQIRRMYQRAIEKGEIDLEEEEAEGEEDEAPQLVPGTADSDEDQKSKIPRYLSAASASDRKGEEEEEEGEEEEGEGEEESPSGPQVLLFFSTQNEVSCHMGPLPDQDRVFRYSMELAPSIAFLLQSYPNFVRISDIPLVAESEELFIEFQNMIVSLWASQLLITSPVDPASNLKKRRVPTEPRSAPKAKKSKSSCCGTPRCKNPTSKTACKP